MPAFKLSKWYLDCVTDAGDTLIAYTGTAQWGKLRLNYSSTLETVSNRIIERHSIRPPLLPEITESMISWRSKALKVDGRWEALSSGMNQTIYRSAEGVIEWACRMPLARVRVGGKQGFGYAENLRMTIAPWTLPIHTLRWGRFTSSTDWVTWIDWQGDYSLRIVYLNGNLLQSSRIEDHKIEASDQMRLSMSRSLVLRDGDIGRTALSVVPGIQRVFPKQLVEMVECKWRSWARLERTGKPSVEGWAIHEKVSWPQ